MGTAPGGCSFVGREEEERVLFLDIHLFDHTITHSNDRMDKDIFNGKGYPLGQNIR